MSIIHVKFCTALSSFLPSRPYHDTILKRTLKRTDKLTLNFIHKRIVSRDVKKPCLEIRRTRSGIRYPCVARALNPGTEKLNLNRLPADSQR